MRSKVALLLAGVAGLLIGALAVYTLRDDPFPVQVLTTSLPSGETVLDLKESPPVPRVNEQTKQLDSNARVQSIHDVARLASDFEQRYALYQLISYAEESDLEKYISQSAEISSKNQQVVALRIIFAKYAELDPHKAIDRALALNYIPKQIRRNLVWRIFNNWTVSDLDAASIAIHDLPDEFKTQAADAIMWRSDTLSIGQSNELARRIGPSESWIDQIVDSNRRETLRTDPRKAFYDRIRNTPHSFERESELSEIAGYWFQTEGASAIPQIYDSLGRADERRSVLRSLIGSINEPDNDTVASVLQMISQFPNQREAKEATNAVFQHWSNSDPKASFEAALQFDDQLVPDSLRSILIRHWASRDAEGLLEEAPTFPRQLQSTAVAAALSELSLETPQTAIQLARKLGTRALRTSARNAIVERWRIYDPKSAFEWLMNNDLDVNVPRDKLLWRYTFSSYLDQDYASARSYVDQYEGEFKAQLVEATSEHLFKLDLKLAVDYMKSLDSEIRSSFLDQFGYSFGEHDPMGALSYGETLEQHQQEAYYQNVLHGWSFHNFSSLLDNIHQVPHKYQSFAARRLLDENAYMHYLTDQELKKLESIAEETKTSFDVE